MTAAELLAHLATVLQKQPDLEFQSLHVDAEGVLQLRLNAEPWPHPALLRWAQALDVDELHETNRSLFEYNGRLNQGLTVDTSWLSVRMYVDVEGPVPA